MIKIFGMITEKDKHAIQESKKQIEEQIEATKKLDLGLDADASSDSKQQPKSSFDGFISENHPSSLDDK